MRQQAMAQHARRRRGFSLAELAMVAVVIAIVGAIAAPRVGSALARQRADAAARRVVVDLALAQREARAASASRSVSFDLGNASYTLTDVEDPKVRGRTYVVKLSEEPYAARLVQVRFAGDSALGFDGFGKATVGGNIIIGVGDHCREIAVQAGSGATAVTAVSCMGIEPIDDDPIDPAPDDPDE